jgi:hypothetical protein
MIDFIAWAPILFIACCVLAWSGLGLLPMIAVRLQLGNLLSTDTTTLDQATNQNEIVLISAPFAASENLTMAGLTVLTTSWALSLKQPLGACLVGTDPVTNQQLVTIPTPAGGWRWIVAGGTLIPVTIYGYALTTKAQAALLGVQLLPTPITLTANGQQIDLGEVTLRFVLAPIS